MGAMSSWCRAEYRLADVCVALLIPGAPNQQHRMHPRTFSPPRPSPRSGTWQEAVWLGRYPTAESAARAHDIAALKFHGSSAETNYGENAYRRVLPTLSAHSGDAVVSALRKDSQLAVQRTSRYRGVRRIAPRAYEARLDEQAPTSEPRRSPLPLLSSG